MALLNSAERDAVVHKPTPSAQAAFSLQELYNRTLRRWEPLVFSGLLASHMSTTSTPKASRVYGAATPARDADTTQWMNVTPGAVADFHNSLGSSGFTPRGSVSSPFEFRFEPDLRRSSLARNEGDEQARGIDEILAAMEDGKEALERAITQAAVEQGKMPKNHCIGTSRSAEFQLLTPETDGSDTPHVSASRQGSFHSPESMASPYVTASSATASIVSKVLPVVSRRLPPTSLMMPNANFVPPPPMCMFFSPAFKDLQQGKVGVWKGDLEIRGRGGGKFSVLIVGEQSTGHLW